jgi:hypothetical protein
MIPKGKFYAIRLCLLTEDHGLSHHNNPYCSEPQDVH